MSRIFLRQILMNFDTHLIYFPLIKNDDKQKIKAEKNLWTSAFQYCKIRIGNHIDVRKVGKICQISN